MLWFAFECCRGDAESKGKLDLKGFTGSMDFFWLDDDIIGVPN